MSDWCITLSYTSLYSRARANSGASASSAAAAAERLDDDPDSDEPLYGEMNEIRLYIILNFTKFLSGNHVQYVHDDDATSENDVQFMGDIFVKNCIFIK